MVALLPNPEPQFCDQDGHPYAGGSIATYVPGTTTPKTTWLDPNETAANTNPIVLDAAGRCVMYGDGDYRLILHDVAGNQIWDQPSSTIVSAAMEPVVSAPTIADALNLLGVTDAIATETANRVAGDTAEQTARIAADNALGTRITNLQTTLTSTVPFVQYGSGTCDSTGHLRVTFATPFAEGAPPVAITHVATTYTLGVPAVNSDSTGFDVWIASMDTSGAIVPQAATFYWVAFQVPYA
jgi:hypothetical protein